MKTKGFTLIELMIVVAILSIISFIAIPAYQNYVKEARIAAARINMEPLRLALEDYRLDNDVYIGGSHSAGSTSSTLTNALGWEPGGDSAKYDYTVSVANGDYTIIIEDTKSDAWARCENGMTKCCYSDGNTAVNSACP